MQAKIPKTLKRTSTKYSPHVSQSIKNVGENNKYLRFILYWPQCQRH